MSKEKKLILVQLNEINFDYFRDFFSSRDYSNLKKLYDLNSYTTYSESEYENLEPWIQWFSAVSGLDAKSHKVFRLGDVTHSDCEQIYEKIEQKGFKVGAILPMNVKNKLKNPAFFIPDPWTETESDNSIWNRLLYKALKQAVNDNSKNRISIKNLIVILISFIKFFNIRNLYLYLKLFIKSFKRPWTKSLFFDLFLHDIHLKYLKQEVNFSSIFFNAGAHIQHHYFFDMIDNSLKNPRWYIKEELNPANDLFEVYDKIVGDYLRHFKNNVIFATGLSQELSNKPFYYYRLKNHKEFLKNIGIIFKNIYPRMSRDFLIEFENKQEAEIAVEQLKLIKTEDGISIFNEIDNRGISVFVSLTFSDEIKNDTVVKYKNSKINLFDKVSFVALKNGIHSPKGYLFTSENIKSKDEKNFHVKKIFNIINEYFLRKI